MISHFIDCGWAKSRRVEDKMVNYNWKDLFNTGLDYKDGCGPSVTFSINTTSQDFDYSHEEERSTPWYERGFVLMIRDRIGGLGKIIAGGRR